METAIDEAGRDNLLEKEGRLVIRGRGMPLSADDIRELRLADQR
ncbi:hypothetical protein AB0O14_10570 [Microbacterium foliorum]